MLHVQLEFPSLSAGAKAFAGHEKHFSLPLVAPHKKVLASQLKRLTICPLSTTAE